VIFIGNEFKPNLAAPQAWLAFSDLARPIHITSATAKIGFQHTFIFSPSLQLIPPRIQMATLQRQGEASGWAAIGQWLIGAVQPAFASRLTGAGRPALGGAPHAHLNVCWNKKPRGKLRGFEGSGKGFRCPEKRSKLRGIEPETKKRRRSGTGAHSFAMAAA
jgi:hypothetical protein